MSAGYERGDAFANSETRTEHKTCGREVDLPVIGEQLRAAYALLTDSDVQVARHRLTDSLLRLLKEAIDGPLMFGACPFDGDVEVSYDPYGTGTWDCLTCDWTHEDD